jgi:hypothetical protein
MFAALDEAMPDALEPRFELRVAEYLTELFGAQASARRAAIRLAQEQADRQRADASSSSVGTLRAISIDSKDSGRFSVGTANAAWEAPPAGVGFVPPGTTRSRRSLAAVALGVGLCGAGLLLQLSRSPARASGSTSASPVPPETPGQQSRVAAAAPVATPEPAALAASSATAAPEPPTVDRHERKPNGGPRTASAPLRARPASSAAPQPTTPATTAASVPHASPTASTNAWDRGAFGGRH